ncbi:MAG: flagellar basal body P-ring formation chaperone FlgA [Proteobacteria bacterium]|nr:flagellar basal body P-ring formation chaperone FlgA [Pseudomonadota bacterium]
MKGALFLILVAALVGGAAKAETAGPAEPLTGQDIAAAVRAVMQAQGQAGAPILADQRRYFPCEVDLTIAPRREGRWDAVDVGCAGAIPWSIVVRTSADVPARFSFGSGADAGQTTTLVVVRHTIRRGEIITADKLDLAEVPRTPAPGVFSEIEPLIGRKMVQTLSAGVPIRERHLQMEWSVRADDPIVIETDSGQMVISMAGIALENGQTGDFIRVRNLRSQKIVVGQVADEKKIIVAPNMN